MRADMGEYRYPFSPFPDGWYAVAFSRDLRPGQVIGQRFMGREVVLYRTESGQAVLADAHCPHLGAHFGHGGTVEGEHLRCPFHGFCFDPSGACIKTGYGTRPPKKARLRVHDVMELNGFVLVYHDHRGRSPEWRVPELPPGDFTDLARRCLTLRGHPQETSENSVDMGHFGAVHGYTNVDVLRPITADGPYLHGQYAMSRDAGPVGLPGRLLRAEFEVHVHGLGYSFVDVHVRELGIHSRHFVCATPTDGEHIDLRLAISLERLREPGKIHPLLRHAPRGVLTRVLCTAMFRAYCHDVMQDFEIWKHKVYIDPPVVAKGDGPIGVYRRWTKQFYPSPLSVVEASAAASREAAGPA